jgi:hypothetical protein
MMFRNKPTKSITELTMCCLGGDGGGGGGNIEGDLIGAGLPPQGGAGNVSPASADPAAATGVVGPGITGASEGVGLGSVEGGVSGGVAGVPGQAERGGISLGFNTQAGKLGFSTTTTLTSNPILGAIIGLTSGLLSGSSVTPGSSPVIGEAGFEGSASEGGGAGPGAGLEGIAAGGDTGMGPADFEIERPITIADTTLPESPIVPEQEDLDENLIPLEPGIDLGTIFRRRKPNTGVGYFDLRQFTNGELNIFRPELMGRF